MNPANGASAEIQSRHYESTQGLLQRILDSTLECAIVLGADMRVATANVAARNIFSREDEALEGRRLSEVIRDAALHDAYRRAVEQNSSSDLRLELPFGDKPKFDVHISPIELDGYTLAIGFFYDVTSIERLERTRNEFLSNISHELRTPLTSILAFVETLEDGAIDDQENNRRFLGVIRRNATRMHSMISDILELSMIESGKISLRIRQLELRPIVNDVVTDLSTKAFGRGIELINDVAEGQTVRGDPERLQQMLGNLVDNAIKFNREFGHVRISCESLAGCDRISVADNGEGILPEHFDRIFERFYRADRARSREVDGTGIGLAIVKHLARLHGGEVTAESELKHGSVFTIELAR